MKHNIFIVIVCLCAFVVQAQDDISKKYFSGKQFFNEGKYNLAMESFKPLLVYDQNNAYAEYASFYYAVSAYYQGYKALAKTQFNQIKTLYPKWEQLHEVDLWLAKIHFDNRDYFQGLKVLGSIHGKGLEQDIDALKRASLKNVTDIETLRMMNEEYPKDEIVARQLATQLSFNVADKGNKELLESLIRTFNFKRAEFIPEAPKSFTKETYSVSVLMPFMANTLEPTPSKKRNQIVLDFYEGMKLAVDTMRSNGVKISLRAYDTERDNSRIKSLLETEELKNTDLIIGPFFQEENKPILEFSLANKVNVLNPFATNSELLGVNPHSLFFQPSLETVGKKSGEFLATYAVKKNCLVFSGPTKRDSILTSNFVQSAKQNGLRIVAVKTIQKDAVKNVLSILATPTEYDEFKYPKEFTLKKDSIGSIFVASDDPLLYVKVVSGVETRGDKVTVLGQETWLENSTLDFEKYQNLPIVLSAPNFTSSYDPDVNAFVKKYIRVHGRVPSAHAKTGYEVMLFAGRQLKEHGVYFQEALSRQSFIEGILYQGFNYQNSRSNQFIPFIRYQDDKMKVINAQ